jgi:CRISPR/Cas system-associated endonuclease Cas1
MALSTDMYACAGALLMEDSQPEDDVAEKPYRAGLARAAADESDVRRAEGARDMEELLGIEGNAARLYFGAFAGMLKAA